MPHFGPESSYTSMDKWNYKDDEITVLTGSKSLDELIWRNKERIVMVCHGHTHDSSPLDFVSGVPILTPNAFYKGKFAHYTICQYDDDWKLKKWEFREYF